MRLWKKRSHPANPSKWLVKMFGGQPTESGVEVTETNALTNTAVFACINVISKIMASVPLNMYERLERGKKKAIDNPLFGIMHDAVNPETPSYTWRETAQGHILTWGNSYSQKVFNNVGRLKELWLLRPDRMTVARVDGQLKYIYLLQSGEKKVFNKEEILHIPGFGFDGMVGYSPITLASDAIGLGKAEEQFGARFYGSGTHPSVVFKYPVGQNLGKDPDSEFLKSLKDGYEGLGKSHKTMVLEDGLEMEQLGVNPADAQFLEGRRFQVEEIARFFQVPQHMIGHLEHGDFSNIEQQSLEFVKYTMQPWFKRWESYLNLNLIPEKDKGKLFFEFNIDGLLRGDIKTRYDAYAISIQNGWNSINDVRIKENDNPIEGGDDHYIPLNLGIVGEEPEKEPRTLKKTVENRAENRSKRSINKRLTLRKTYRGILKDAIQRIVNREVNDTQRAAKKYLGKRNKQEFLDWVDDYYEESGDFATLNLEPIYRAYSQLVSDTVSDEVQQDVDVGDDFVRSYLTVYITQRTISSKRQLREVLGSAIEEGIDELEAVTERLDEWKENRAEKDSLWQSTEAEGAFTKRGYVLAGVTKIRWTAHGKNCPYCNAIDGKVIGVEKTFLRADEPFKPDGAPSEMVTKTDITHPPMHQGCDCSISIGG